MNNNDKEFLIQKIRSEYTAKEATDLDALQMLDAKVKRPCLLFSYLFGAVSALIMGAGMSLVMTDLGQTLGMADPLIPGVIIGVVGLLMAVVNYPIFKAMLTSRRKKYADEVLALSEKILRK